MRPWNGTTEMDNKQSTFVSQALHVATCLFLYKPISVPLHLVPYAYPESALISCLYSTLLHPTKLKRFTHPLPSLVHMQPALISNSNKTLTA